MSHATLILILFIFAAYVIDAMIRYFSLAPADDADC